jgi:hypothetical protein
MHFELFLRNLLAEGKDRFTCIIGSGFNARITCTENILASWKLLYGRVLGKVPEGESPHLAVERYLLSKGYVASEPARVQALVKALCNHVEWETQRLLRGSFGGFPDFLFDPAWVSDVLTLNVDDWVETNCRMGLGARISGWRLPTGFEGRLGYDKESLRYRELRFPGGGKIRIWHLNGSVLRPSGIQLGLGRYTRRAGQLEALRRHYRRSAGKSDPSPTWYSALHNPLLIVGASIPAMEWELWSAIADRERWNALPENREIRRPVFHMRSRNEGFQRDWFLPLFEEVGAYGAQWDKLEEVVRRSVARLRPDSRR